MSKLPQHGGFDPALEASVRRMLEAEFSESEDTSENVEFAQVCQRKDGSIYGTQGQCRKGTPISIGPGEGMPAIAKKAKARGLKQTDVKSIADAVREKYGAKVVKKGSALESAVRRLNERLQPEDAKPADRSLRQLGTRSLEKEQLMAGSRGLRARQEMVRRVLGEAPKPAPAPKPKGEGTVAVDAKIREMQKGLARVRDLKDNASTANAARIYGSVEKAMQREIKKLGQAGESTKAKAAAAAKADRDMKAARAAAPKAEVVKRKEGGIHDVIVNGQRVGFMLKMPGDPRYEINVGGKQELVKGLAMARARALHLARNEALAKGIKPATGKNQPPAAKEKRLAVGKKLLQGARTSELMRILKEESLNGFQRKKIEDELRKRGLSSDAIPQKAGQAGVRRAARAAAEPAKFNIPEGRKGYDVKAAFSQDGKVLGSGAMGEAKLVPGPPPAVVKKGKIGEQEAAAIKKLEGSGVTPTFYGAEITGAGKRVQRGLGGHVKEADGLLAMSPMDGLPAKKSMYTMTSAQTSEMFDEYLKTRKIIHERGVAHNDMHGGNFFYDPKTKKAGLVDFGLSQVSPRAALVEAMGLGGSSGRGGDWQANRIRAGVTKDGPALRRFNENHAEVTRELKERFGITRLPEIRSSEDTLAVMLKGLSDRNAELLIKRLYDGV